MKKKDNNLIVKLLFFIIWPFGAFLHSIQKPYLHSSRVIIYIWFIIFGLCFLPIYEVADSYYYAQEFALSKNMNAYSYQKAVSSFFSNSYDTEHKDIYVLTINYLVSRVTDNVHVLFMVFAMVFGFFYVKSMKYVFEPGDLVRNDFILLFYILLGWFCISNPIFNINGVRFWTAAWMAVFIMLRHLIYKDNKILLLLPLLYFVHASFVIFIAVFLINVFLGRFHKTWNIIFVVSLFFSGLSFLPMLTDYIMDYLPRNLQFMIQYYSSEEYIAYKADKLETLSGLAHFFLNLPKVAINLTAVICLLNRGVIENNKSSNRVLEFTIVLLSLINFLSTIPSVGRFMNTAVPFLVYILISNINISKQYKWAVYLVPVMYIYPIYLWLLNMHEVTSLSIFVTPLPYHIINYLFV